MIKIPYNYLGYVGNSIKVKILIVKSFEINGKSRRKAVPCFTNPVKPGPLSGLRTIVCSVNTDPHFRVLIRAANYFSVNETISQQEEIRVRSSRKICF